MQAVRDTVRWLRQFSEQHIRRRRLGTIEFRPRGWLCGYCENPTLTARNMPPPRDTGARVVLKSSGPASNQTRLHQEPGHLGLGAPMEADATADPTAKMGFPLRLAGSVSEGNHLANWVPLRNGASCAGCRREHTKHAFWSACSAISRAAGTALSPHHFFSPAGGGAAGAKSLSGAISALAGSKRRTQTAPFQLASPSQNRPRLTAGGRNRGSRGTGVAS